MATTFADRTLETRTLTGGVHAAGSAGAVGAGAGSAASWGAIFAGGVVAAAVSLLLLALGAGLGFASVSPWAGHGVAAGTFTIAAAIWLIVMQWVSSLFGGYITGRLRTRWHGTHPHEIFFRDTANGFVTWALATIVVATVAVSSASSGIGGGVRALSTVAAAGAQGAAQGGAQGVAQGALTQGSLSGAPASLAYGLDKLFRTGGAGGAAAGSSDAAGGGGADPRLEAGRIVVNALADGTVPDADRSYLVALVAARTGSSDADAQKRVDDFIAGAMQAQAKVKEEADVARKDAAEVSIYTALAMLIGAFIASVSAALGGRLRDEHL